MVTLDRAREAVAGRVSLSTLEAMIQKGRLSVALPIVEAVAGQSLAHFFRELRDAHDDQGKRLATLFVDPRGPGGADPRWPHRSGGMARHALNAPAGRVGVQDAAGDLDPDNLDLFEARL
jgi:hypothetical protein